MTDERKKRLLELYEARGDPDTFAEAKRLYEQALAGAEASDPETLVAYGYLLECHGGYALRQAVAEYERAIELDPDADKHCRPLRRIAARSRATLPWRPAPQAAHPAGGAGRL